MRLLELTEHRPYPIPDGPWVMEQTWSNLLFAHWPLAPEVLQPFIPDGLVLDTFDSKAWISVVPFKMSNIRPRMTMAVPWLSFFEELNVRTYVVADGRPGVLFFSLDAANPVGVWIARTWYQLPYFNAKMICDVDELTGTVNYSSIRQDDRAPMGEFRGSYRPIAEPYIAPLNSLDYFLTARYCLYTVRRDGTLMRGEIHHAPWPLQLAEAEIEVNTVSSIVLPNIPPILQYVETLDVLAWPIRPVK